MNAISFMALGGAQSIGDSCYIIKFGRECWMLDCGSRRYRGAIQGPPLDLAVRAGLLDSPSQLMGVVISHAHMDHVGYLPSVLAQSAAPIYMTPITKVLTEYQLFDRQVAHTLGYTEEQCWLNEKLATQYQGISFLKPIHIGEVEMMGIPAGHIPGAMMVEFNYKGRSILYTGDYSLAHTALTAGCMVPSKPPDILLICGTHAKHPVSRSGYETLFNKVQKIYEHLENGVAVRCVFSQLSKGLEVLKALTAYGKERGLTPPIYVSSLLWRLVEKMERAEVRLLEANTRPESEMKRAMQPYIRLQMSGEKPTFGLPCRWNVGKIREGNFPADFTLHDSFDEMIQLIKRLQPKLAIVVHSPGNPLTSTSVEQVLMKDPDCQTQFLFPEQGELYCL